MRLLYTHGFNSGPSSASARKLRETFPDMDVSVLSYTCAETADSIFASLLRKAKKASESGPIALVGSSLGGYYTARLAAALGLPCVLANPCNDPRASLRQFLGNNISFEDGHAWIFEKKALESYEPLNPAMLGKLPRLVIVGRNDILLDPLENAAFWKDHARVEMTADEHSIASFEPLKAQMLEIFNSWQSCS